MRLCFDSIDEVKDFVKGLKGTRGGKAGEGDDAGPQTSGQTAPAPLQPPPIPQQGFMQPAAFAPPGPGAAPMGGAFPAAGATALAPEVAAIVNRIVVRGEAAVASGQPAEAMLTWFRGQLGPETANATWEQVKTHFLPKASMPTLEGIAKLMAA